MPLLKCSEDPLPEWSDLDSVEIIRMKKGESGAFRRKSPKEKFFVGDGSCRVNFNGAAEDARTGDSFTVINPADQFRIDFAETDLVIVRICGKWGNETGSSGVFSVAGSSTPHNSGDPAEYPRTTKFDNHYHDCDEYWVIFQGSGTAVSEGISYNLKPDYFLATKMGDHHDIPGVSDEIYGVWFESTLKGRKRKGHLWNHTHGAPGLLKNEN